MNPARAGYDKTSKNERIQIYPDNNSWYFDFSGPSGAKPAQIGPLPVFVDEATRETYTVINRVRYGVTPISKQKDARSESEQEDRKHPGWFQKWCGTGLVSSEQLAMKAAKQDHLLAWIYLWNQNQEALASPSRIKQRTTCWIHRACSDNAYFIMAAFTFLGKDQEQLHMLNLQNIEGKRPIHIACAAGHLPLVATLLMCGSNPDKPDDRGKTAMHYACEAGHVPIVTYMLSHKVTANIVSADNFTPLHLAIAQQHAAVVDAMLSSARFAHIWDFQQPPRSSTLLHEAINAGSFEIVQLLVDKLRRDPRDVGAVDHNDMTPLQLAEWYHKEEMNTDKAPSNQRIVDLVQALTIGQQHRSTNSTSYLDVDSLGRVTLSPLGRQKSDPLSEASLPGMGAVVGDRSSTAVVQASNPNESVVGIGHNAAPGGGVPSSGGSVVLGGVGQGGRAAPPSAVISGGPKSVIPPTPAYPTASTSPQYPPYISCNLDILKQLRWLTSATPLNKLSVPEDFLRSYILDVRAGREAAWEYLSKEASRGVLLTPALACLLSQKPYCGHWNSIKGTGCPEPNCAYPHVCIFCDQTTHAPPFRDEVPAAECEYPPSPCPRLLQLREALSTFMSNQAHQDVQMSFEDVHAFALLPM